MGYKEMIARVQQSTGFTGAESKDALDATVECTAVRLDDAERRKFAAQLPAELQNIALSVYPSIYNTRDNMLELMMELQHASRLRAKKQLLSAWGALKQVLGAVEIKRIHERMPRKVARIMR